MAGITERQIKKWGFTLPPGGLAALTRAEITVLNKMQADTKYNPPEGALARLRASPTKPKVVRKSTSPADAKPPQLRKPKDDKPRRKQSNELETSLAAARKKGDPYYFNEKLGKKMAAVTKEDLEKSGLNLTQYMNRLTGLDSPGAFESKRKRKTPPLPKRKPQRKLSESRTAEIKAGLDISKALERQAEKEKASDTRRFLSVPEETALLAKWKKEKKQPRKKSNGAKKSRTGNTDYRKGGLFY